jgi:broad specificity phosphatase PhoE
MSPELIDAGLSPQGERQAINLPKSYDVTSVECIISSPLTRAVSTACLAFRELSTTGVPFVVYYGIREIGSKIPENRPRETRRVMESVLNLPVAVERVEEWIDFETNKPDAWPETSEKRQSTAGNDWTEFYNYLSSRDESTIAVVCHFNVINSILKGQISRSVENCLPFECWLTDAGLVVKQC